jgi:hypothetical protein
VGSLRQTQIGLNVLGLFAKKTVMTHLYSLQGLRFYWEILITLNKLPPRCQNAPRPGHICLRNHWVGATGPEGNIHRQVRLRDLIHIAVGYDGQGRCQQISRNRHRSNRLRPPRQQRRLPTGFVSNGTLLVDRVPAGPIWESPAVFYPQHFLYFFPLPQGQASLRPGFFSATLV